MALIDIGSEAPDIEATTGSGETFRLKEQLASGRVMLVFYPKDFTSGCTTQLVNVQRSLPEMRAAGVEPFGVNPDDAESHAKFCDAYDLEFELIVDADKSAAGAFGTLKDDGGIQRAVFVIGQDGKIEFAQEGAPSWDEVKSGVGLA